VRHLGATPRPDGTTSFRVWAPNASTVEVRIGGESHPLGRGEGDSFEAELRAGPGEDYVYVLDGGRALPDPCSRFQPEGIAEPSRIVDVPRNVRLGLSLDELVVYELHVGAFSPEGTFDGVVPHLRALRELGVTAIELMPVATFPGNRGWGYDGVYVSAPHPAYGGPAGLGRLVEAAHGEGLGVILDVVYNHVGPGAEALTAFGPYLGGRRTSWGRAVDFSQPGVREWAIQNALLWVEEYGVDGLRLDAIQAIEDGSPRHVLAELAERVHARTPRALVIAETFTGDERPLRDWGHDARWSDGLHHALHALLTGEREGYYARYGTLEGVVAELARHPAAANVVYAQNHDQVGNRARGDRLAPALLHVASSVVLFSTQTPLLFMGEEYGEEQPFQFFADHVDPGAADAAREGRKREFAAWSAFAGDVPDPQDPATFRRSKLSRRARPGVRDHYRRLLALRRRLPREVHVQADGSVLRIRRGEATLVADFGACTAELPMIPRAMVGDGPRPCPQGPAA
jgi:maltooligosyltrehalose trehalohydrolase